ncbi:MAG: phage tail tube protein [Rhodanobacter sp.]
MSTNPNLFSFQGRVLLGTRDANGKPLSLQWVGDVDPCQIKLATTTDDVFESYTGNRQQIGRMIKQTKADLSMTFKQWSTNALAMALYSAAATVVSGTVTAEPLPTVVAGDSVKLANNGVTALTIVDSAGTPATVPPANYLLPQSSLASANNGVIDWVDVGAFTQPFKASYSYAGVVNLALFTAPAPERYFVLDGVDTETGQPVTVRLYKLRLDPISQLDIINDGYGNLPVAGSVLFDPLNASDGTLGGFGRIERVG